MRDAGARLHLRVVHEGRRVAILEHVIGRRANACVDIAALVRDRLRLVARVQREVALGPDLRRVGLQRLFRIEHERQHLVVDRDQLQRLFGDVPIDGGDGGDRIAHEPHRVVERVAPLLGDLLDLVVVLLAAGDRAGAPHDLAVLVRDDRLDARQRLRLRRRRSLRMRACGCGLRSTRAYSMPGSCTSPV